MRTRPTLWTEKKDSSTCATVFECTRISPSDRRRCRNGQHRHTVSMCVHTKWCNNFSYRPNAINGTDAASTRHAACVATTKCHRALGERRQTRPHDSSVKKIVPLLFVKQCRQKTAPGQTQKGSQKQFKINLKKMQACWPRQQRVSAMWQLGRR